MNIDDLGEFELSPEAKKKLKNKAYLRRQLAKGVTAQAILGFTDETMVKFYRAAFHLFENGKYLDAANAFLFLVTLNPHKHDFWLGLGMATQLNGDFEGAIDAYEMAAYYKLDNPVPYFYLAKCLFAIHDRDSALQAIELAIEYSNDLDEYADLQREASAAKDLLLKNK